MSMVSPVPESRRRWQQYFKKFFRWASNVIWDLQLIRLSHAVDPERKHEISNADLIRQPWQRFDEAMYIRKMDFYKMLKLIFCDQIQNQECNWAPQKITRKFTDLYFSHWIYKNIYRLVFSSLNRIPINILPRSSINEIRLSRGLLAEKAFFDASNGRSKLGSSFFCKSSKSFFYAFVDFLK
jgi:hypothetical protein